MDNHEAIRRADKAVLEEIKKTEAYAKMVEILDEDMVHKMLQDSIKNNTTPVCCYRCAEQNTCEPSKLVPWGMSCSTFILEKHSSKDTNKTKYFDEMPIVITGKTCGSDRSAFGGYVSVDGITVKIELTDANIMAIGKRYFELCQEKTK